MNIGAIIAAGLFGLIVGIAYEETNILSQLDKELAANFVSTHGKVWACSQALPLDSRLHDNMGIVP